MPKKKKEEDIPVIYLKQAFEYSAKDDLAGAGMMLRALRACVNISHINKKIDDDEHDELSSKLDKLENKPSEKIYGSVYSLCDTFSANPDEIEMRDKAGNVTGSTTPQRLKHDLRVAMDELTKIAAGLTKTLGVELSIIGKELKGIGVSE